MNFMKCLLLSAAFLMSIEAQSADVKLRVGKFDVTVIPNGCVASLWAGDEYLSPDRIRKSAEKHINGEIVPSQISSPLMVAVVRREFAEVTMLLDSGVDVNETNESGCTALIWAASFEEEDLVETLLNAGAHVNQTDAAGRTALMNASQTPSLEVVRVLIRAGADVNISQSGGAGEVGDTALMDAAENGQLENLKYLLLSGAKAGIKNAKGQTAYQIAIERKKFDAAEILESVQE